MSCLSIIIPVYNAEKYLNKCIDSILNQSFKDFELLLIDDGSKDLSGKICDKYAEVDERVKVFHIQNGGPAKARNLGIKYATGIYIEFVDADDELIPEALENLYILTKNNPDIIIADSQIITADEKVKNIIHNKSRLYRRLVNAFPNIKEKVQFKKWTLKEKLEDIKRQIKKEA